MLREFCYSVSCNGNCNTRLVACYPTTTKSLSHRSCCATTNKELGNNIAFFRRCFYDTFKQCFRSFYDYLQAGDFNAPPTFPTFADGHREIVLCEAIARSHREGGWVAVEGGAS